MFTYQINDCYSTEDIVVCFELHTSFDWWAMALVHLAAFNFTAWTPKTPLLRKTVLFMLKAAKHLQPIMYKLRSHTVYTSLSCYFVHKYVEKNLGYLWLYLTSNTLFITNKVCFRSTKNATANDLPSRAFLTLCNVFTNASYIHKRWYTIIKHMTQHRYTPFTLAKVNQLEIIYSN